MKHYGMGDVATDVYGVTLEKIDCARKVWTATELVAADPDGIIDGGSCSASETVTLYPDTGAKMPCARNVTCKPGGTSANIKAVQVTVYGKDLAGEAITETLPAFTEDSATQVAGDKAFAEITKIEVPAMDGSGVTVDLGWGNKLGIPYKCDGDFIITAAVYNATKESTLPTVAKSDSVLASNTVTFNTTLNGKQGSIYILI